MIIWYLYAVAGADDVTGIDLPEGIDGGPVLTVVHGDLAAIAGEVDRSRFEAAQVKPDLNERGWLAKALRAHDRVVRRVFAQVPLVRLRFGALAAGHDALTELLSTQHDQFRAALDVARDTAEWRVRVIPRRPSEVDSSSGAAMMTRWCGGATRTPSPQRLSGWPGFSPVPG